MKVWAAFGALLSLLAGAPGPESEGGPLPDDPAGYIVEGGDFYVWEEDREEAERWAAELARSRPAERA